MNDRRALIAGVGQPWMRDLAFGSHVVAHMKKSGLPADIDALDLSFNPITAMEMIRDGNYGRVVFVTARAAGRPPGAIYEVRPPAEEATPEQTHAHIGDAVMGCVSLDTLLVICRFHRALPPQTTILEVEPEDESWGPDLSAPLQELVARAAERALECVQDV